MSLLESLRLRVGAAIAGVKGNDMSASAIVRAQRSLGPWQDALGYFTPRQVNPYFYEALREAIGPLDGGINRLVTVDGIIRVRGGNDRIVGLIEDGLLANIPVNDMEAGLQAFYASQGNEVYEQGFAIGEKVMDAKGKELVGLRVADSKGVYFRRGDDLVLQTFYRPPWPRVAGRRDGTDQVETVLRNRVQAATDWLLGAGFVPLDPARLIYVAHQPEADSPYGVSILRSIEFVAQLLLRMQNATGQVWDRFGDPPLQLTYKTKNRTLKGADLDKRRAALGDELAKVMGAKRAGNSADFVQAIGADDDITIGVIGANGKELTLEFPARHMMEQILAKFGLPAWMMGMQLGTAERMAEHQSEVVLQESRTRFEKRLPGLRDVVATWLRGRGITWKPGDWELYQELPRLQDMLKEAQAGFLRAQTEMMQRGAATGGQPVPPTDAAIGKVFRVKHDGAIEFLPACEALRKRAPRHPHAGRKVVEVEPWAENDPALPKIEARAITGTIALWDQLRDRTLARLGLDTTKRAKTGEPTFTFDAVNLLKQLLDDLDWFTAAASAEQGPLLREAWAAWVRGLENAAEAMDASAVIDAARSRMQETVKPHVLEYVSDAAVRSFEENILAELQQGLYDGVNPREVAQRLSDKFALHEYDWERLARSEIVYAHALGKEEQYKALDVTMYDFVTASDACVICGELADAGPYEIGKGPLPMRDSHPNCRCTTLAHVE